jgi:hypothetical protein
MRAASRGAAVASLAFVAAAATANPCPLKAQAIAKALGGSFDEGVADPSGAGGNACLYKSKGSVAPFNSNISVRLAQMPMQGSFDTMRMFLGPLSTKFHPVAGDADGARTVEQAPSVPKFPSVVYFRGGQMVTLHITGGIYPEGEAARKALIDQTNPKLLALPRVP